MDELRPNSYRSREPKQEPESRVKNKVAAGGVKVKKKSNIGKLADAFLAEDIKSVQNYLIFDVIAPAIKNCIADVINNGTNMFLFGTTKKSQKSSGSAVYGSYYRKNEETKPQRRSERRLTGYEYEDIVFDSRVDAELVLNELDEVVSQYEIVSVADFMMAATGKVDDNYMNKKYGWKNLSSAEIRPVAGGYIIKFPKAQLIN